MTRPVLLLAVSLDDVGPATQLRHLALGLDRSRFAVHDGAQNVLRDCFHLFLREP